MFCEYFCQLTSHKLQKSGAYGQFVFSGVLSYIVLAISYLALAPLCLKGIESTSVDSAWSSERNMKIEARADSLKKVSSA